MKQSANVTIGHYILGKYSLNQITIPEKGHGLIFLWKMLSFFITYAILCHVFFI